MPVSKHYIVWRLPARRDVTIVSITPVSLGSQHAVSAGHEQAAIAAFEILESGGNAIDAAVAGCLTLCVVYSDQVSFAGVAPMMLYLSQTDEVITLAGVGGWPAKLDVDAYIKRHGGEIPSGLQRTVVPAAPDAYIQALQRYGTRSFSDVAARAIRCATAGIPVHSVMHDYIDQYSDSYRLFPDNMAIWMPDGQVPEVGYPLVQRDLGSTLQFLCDEEQAAGGDRRQKLEAVQVAFYRGDIAQEIVKHQRDSDGLLSAQDLMDFRCPWLPSVSRQYTFATGDVEIHACDAWSQGPSMLEALAIIEHLDLKSAGFGSEDYLHALAETFKLALSDREAYIGDPDFVDVPVEALISRQYGAARAQAIDALRASPGMPEPGRIDGYSPFQSPVIARTTPAKLPADTSIVAVIDAEGNAVCVTPSDTSWDTPVVPGTGLAISSRGDQSRAIHGHPACLAPGKRPRLTPNPCFARRQGQWIMPFGTPGGDTQIQANVQMLHAHLDFGLSLQQAIEAPRLMTHSHPDSFAPHRAQPGRLTIEGRFDESTAARLIDRGHQVERLDDWTHKMAGVCAVRKDLADGQLQAAADPRRTSRSLAW
jgi:gamma-glutamyltranspeptidase/glutathione hydrolase